MADIYHVLPINDIDHHHESMSCPCNPKVDDECENVIIHNAFDGREFTEERRIN